MGWRVAHEGLLLSLSNSGWVYSTARSLVGPGLSDSKEVGDLCWTRVKRYLETRNKSICRNLFSIEYS